VVTVVQESEGGETADEDGAGEGYAEVGEEETIGHPIVARLSWQGHGDDPQGSGD